jgi:serine/threonine protein kinase
VKVIELAGMEIEAQMDLKKQLSKEISVMKTLNESPRIIRLLGVSELPDKQQLVVLMELAVGGTVAGLLRDQSIPLSDGQKGMLIAETAIGMWPTSLTPLMTSLGCIPINHLLLKVWPT